MRENIVGIRNGGNAVRRPHTARLIGLALVTLFGASPENQIMVHGNSRFYLSSGGPLLFQPASNSLPNVNETYFRILVLILAPCRDDMNST